jgi:hypothetical protein
MGNYGHFFNRKKKGKVNWSFKAEAIFGLFLGLDQALHLPKNGVFSINFGPPPVF